MAHRREPRFTHWICGRWDLVASVAQRDEQLVPRDGPSSGVVPVIVSAGSHDAAEISRRARRDSPS